MQSLSQNTQAILLLTAPLIIGRSKADPDLLKPREYKGFARHLHEIGSQPADLIKPGGEALIEASKHIVDPERIRRLLGRGFQLSQAVERWHTRAIWVVSRADPEYPGRLKSRLRGEAPAVLYGCGEPRLLDEGGLAVVGSRNIDDDLLDYTLNIGRLAAASGRQIVSGGARGIDQAAMRGALEAGGRVSGILADSLEKQAMTREHRSMLLDGMLTLASPYDPCAGFNVGNAMQRNKLIYALSDAALVVSSDFNKGGTWAGAVEQLDKLRLVPVFVRTSQDDRGGLAELKKRGALAWPEPDSPDNLDAIFDATFDDAALDLLDFQDNSLATEKKQPGCEPKANHQKEPTHLVEVTEPDDEAPHPQRRAGDETAEMLFAVARSTIERLGDTGTTEAEVAEALQIEKVQARKWLKRLVDDGALEKKTKPVRYVSVQDRLL